MIKAVNTHEVDEALKAWAISEGISEELRDWILGNADGFIVVDGDESEETVVAMELYTTHHDHHAAKLGFLKQFVIQNTGDLTVAHQDRLTNITRQRQTVNYDAAFRRSIGVYIVSMYRHLRKRQLDEDVTVVRTNHSAPSHAVGTDL